MTTTQSFTVTLPPDLADLVEAKVRSGQYADGSDMILDGLRSLAATDAALETWLWDEVLPIYDAARADPTRALSADDAWTRLKAHMERGSNLPPDA